MLLFTRSRRNVDSCFNQPARHFSDAVSLLEFIEMSTLALVPLSEYLGHTTDPDCEYVDGHLVARNVGEIGHSEAQGRTYAFVFVNCRNFWAGVEVRVQVRAERYRVPDVVIVRGGRPRGRIITAPPDVAVEVLSPEDRAGDVQDKIDDYLQFGIPVVWVIDPDRRRAWIHTAKQGAREVLDGVLRNAAGDLEVPFSAVFVEQA
jgi:Uma2 family endonuclease